MMKINEIEAIVGISKKNIRFYEEEGLLSPKRNNENSYRDYGEKEIEILKNIKFLRKLGVPISEIKNMLSGTSTVSDGMRRHLISLERDKRNLDQCMVLCEELKNFDSNVLNLDTDLYLCKMEDMEKSGTTFVDNKKRDVNKSYTAAIVITSLVILFMLGMICLLIWAFSISPEEAPPLWFLIIVIGIFVSIMVGVVIALIQRLKEINKGELEDAKRY